MRTDCRDCCVPLLPEEMVAGWCGPCASRERAFDIHWTDKFQFEVDRDPGDEDE